MKKILVSLFFGGLALLSFGTFAQSPLDDIRACPEKAGGVYYAYPVTESLNTAPPKGYKPFYISHYGRHGSRYLISDNDYINVINIFDKAKDAGVLTDLGLDVKVRLDSVWKEAEGRGGELTPLGARQHHDIAQRMWKAFPEAFAGKNPEVTAASTVVMRCAHSMFAFCEGLKELQPSLQIPKESGMRNMNYLNYHSPESAPYSSDKGAWFQEYRKFEADKVKPARLVSTLFNDSTYVRRYVDPDAVMWGLYWVAVDMQNMETKLSFMDLFTPEELHNLWEAFNFRFYACDSSYPLANGEHVYNAGNLVNNIITTADEYIQEGKNGATLRFGHDGNIIPLTAFMQFPGCAPEEENPYKVGDVFSTYTISPMASNVQLVFFKNAAGDVIMKCMLNEREQPLPIATDMYPFYKWDDVKTYLKSRMKP